MQPSRALSEFKWPLRIEEKYLKVGILKTERLLKSIVKKSCLTNMSITYSSEPIVFNTYFYLWTVGFSNNYLKHMPIVFIYSLDFKNVPFDMD